MDLNALVEMANAQGASDLHLESGLPPATRVRGSLRTAGAPVAGKDLAEAARKLIGPDRWNDFLERRSFDLSRTLNGVRCRINIMHTARGVGMSIRLLSAFEATIDNLNLHPDLKKFVQHAHGLLILTGPTGSGKSSTMAALIQEINHTEARHIITVENPIEYTFRPRLSYIRQREVGRDTPSFEQALLDALREDPDVLMVGEMREPEVMRLTLNASETGHLVLATMHSGNCVEALQRIVSAFPAESQNAVRAQLADSLIGVVAQRLRYRADLKIRVPELEILTATHPVKHFIRSGDMFKMQSVMETGADQGMWTFARYGAWLQKKTSWHLGSRDESAEADDYEPTAPVSAPAVALPVATAAPAEPVKPQSKHYSAQSRPIEIEPVEGGLEELIKKLGE